MAAVNLGPTKLRLSRDADGHREYKVDFKVRCELTDGPATALACLTLPATGQSWAFGSEVDLWAWCRNDAEVTMLGKEDEPCKFYIVTKTFSTRPTSRCRTDQVEDPLLQPMRVSGSFVRGQEEAVTNRYGAPITNSAHEQLRGPQLEFDVSADQVRIEQNVAVLDLPTVAAMKDTLNETELWGFGPRCIKLSEFSWEQKYYGECEVYYQRNFTFDIKVRTDPDTGLVVSGWDRDLLDEGTKVLNGHWSPTTGDWVLDNIGGAAPDPSNPRHFIRAKDLNGENMKVVLDGAGKPITVDPGTGTAVGTDPGMIHVEKYGESDFLLLGIPTEI